MSTDKFKENIHHPSVRSFGQEWTRFTQENLPEKELKEIFSQYFRIFPWKVLPKDAVGFDLGCGSGRWGKFVAPRVGILHCIEPSLDALIVARRNLAQFDNCKFHQASVDSIPLEDGSMDFGYSLGVLDHIPDTQKGIESCVRKLKRGAPFLLYIYYAFENRPLWFRLIWSISNIFRKGISVLPFFVKYWIIWAIAILVYYPVAKLSLALELLGISVENIPLSAYRRRSFYTMRTDAFDRFATPLEKRFRAEEIRNMMERSGLGRIVFSNSVPYWCAVGYKK